jgi:aspartate/methionine/tyrosine aminotransferase
MAGVIMPIPQYPLFSASLAKYNMDQVTDYLDESRNSWALEKDYQAAKENSEIKAIVVINLGNSTGRIWRLLSRMLRRSCSSFLIRFISKMFILKLHAEVVNMEPWVMAMLQKASTLVSYADRAKLLPDTLHSIQGITGNTVQGAMYAFLCISLSEMAMIAAKEAGQSACVLRLSPA